MAHGFDDDNIDFPSVQTLLAQLTAGLPRAVAWALCEPVELIAGNRDLVCLGNAHVAFAQEEADAFVATFNAYWEGSGFVLYAVKPLQWVLALPEPLTSALKPLRASLNQPLDTMTGLWNRLFTEAQMLMQGHPVNRARTSNALPTVNGVWFSTQ